MNVWTCKHCGKANPENLRLCLDCGRTQNGSSKSKYVWCLVLVTLITALGFFVVREQAWLPWAVKQEASATIQRPSGKSSTPETGGTVVQAQSKPVQPVQEKTERSSLKRQETDVKLPMQVVEQAVEPTSETIQPKPRKRLPSNVSFTPVEHPELRRKIKTLGMIEREFTANFDQAISAQLGRVGSDIPTEIEAAKPHLMRIRCDTRSSDFLLLSTQGNLTPQQRARLEAAVMMCSGSIPCPREIRDNYGVYFEFETTILIP